MTLFYYDPIVLEHNTGNHPECARRLRTVMQRLDQADVLKSFTRPEWNDVTEEQVHRVHTAETLDSIQRFIERGGGQIEQDTIVSEKSWQAASRASGAACDAVRRVVEGEDRNAFCLMRPPGHHAMHQHPMGFCLVNHIAIAARSAIQALNLNRVLIIDWDVHHGNGTQATFWEDPQVAFLSMHRFPFYPGSGDESETGQGRGAGLTVNLPIEFGTSRQMQLDRFRNATETLADRFQPELILLSAGFDSHKDDPVGCLSLESEDFITLTDIVMDLADAHCQGRLVSLLEGGYNPEALAECVQIHLERLNR
ncbi:MAG: histone deacetylase [Planctomycetota bacterium]